MQQYEKDHIAALRPYLADCCVLLKKNGAFPLDGPCRIAAFGGGVRNTVKGGTGSGEVNSKYYVTVEMALVSEGFTITSGLWLRHYDELRKAAKEDFGKKTRAKAYSLRSFDPMSAFGAVMPEPEYDLPLSFDADAAIYVLSRISGEGSDRKNVKGDFRLTDTEVRDILALDARYEKFMLVLNTGGPVDLSPVAGVGNILVLSQLGVETGFALTDILLGKASPSGRLATSWSRFEEYCPDVDISDPDDSIYREGVYVGYRYFDSIGKKAMFPFGYGLSYTEFRYHSVKVSAEGSTVTVSARATNKGKAGGREVLQLYMSSPAEGLDKPYQDLAGFAKTGFLQPGQSQTVSISFDLRDLAVYDEGHERYVLEKGSYVLRLGKNSVDTAPVAVIRLDDEVIVREAPRCTPISPYSDNVYRAWRAEEDLSALPVIAVDPAALTDVRTPADCRVLDITNRLTNEELALFCTGAFGSGKGSSSFIGEAAEKVCGAAGESFSMEGVPPMVMADGPAGLRLSRSFYRDEKGLHDLGASMPESIVEMLPKPVRAVMGAGKKPAVPEGAVIGHQYATAIPIGTAVAQSFDTAFAELCGDIVGDEMQRFGVQLWLAPALNIHRSVLCGRNFEYFSEDPLVSGKMAAALTEGVQKHSGCGVTIKHFAANSQELNRMHSSSWVSERALRQIYLKGFEICIRKAQPCAVMSSYNLINGVHSSELRSLSEGFLRSECGFEGVLMTDWVVGIMSNLGKHKHKGADAGCVMKAGGDLFMPGSRNDADDIMDSVRSGSLTRQQLKENASRVIRMARLLKE